MPHNGFIYEAQMDMMENSGHWLYWHNTDPYNVGSVAASIRPPDALPLEFEGLYKDYFNMLWQTQLNPPTPLHLLM